MNYIEELLFEKTEKQQEGIIYADQWRFAKSYLPKVLDTISHVFPHYSLHNSTHSETIINNIIKIVGKESIEKLSIVDLWLLLAASYYHDCGMVVTGKDKEDLFREGSDFLKYVQEKREDPSSPMNRYATLFEVRDKKLFFKNEQLTKDSYEGGRFLIADYIRSKHAERSGKRIETEESLHFPGEPIPERIIRILKSICDCHTKTVEEVMSLQAIESSGCGVEDCHPRFVAAMLRLGDLLDVDSNRVSEVLLSTLGSIPSDSQYYNQTNRAITHIRIDQSIIEITAECNDYYVADLINRWFQWLNDELVFYMQRWHLIIPSKDFGYLPTVGDLIVNLKDYDTFDGKKRPSFDIDSNKAIELLQGAGLYTDSCECIRELLQNAVDATYLRVYKENPGIKNLDEFRKKCSQYPIEVKMDCLLTEDAKEKSNHWQIEIKDQGIGMSKEDLQFLSKTGSSSNNLEKKQLIQSVPEYLWPSGAFGIGFQSVFLITDKVSITTRKLNKDNYVIAQMHNPAGKEKGAILVQSVNKEDVAYGTSLSFEFVDDKKWGHFISADDRFAFSEFQSFDFAKDKEKSLMGVRVMDEIVRFAQGALVPISLFLEGVERKYNYEKLAIPFGEIDSETGIQICVNKIMSRSAYRDNRVYFRNQLVKDFDPYIPFLSFHINILKGSAKDILTLSRNTIRREIRQDLVRQIKASIIRYLNKYIDTLDETIKQLAAAYLEYSRNFINEQGIAGIDYRVDWKNYALTVKKVGTEEKVNFTLEALLKSNSIELIINETRSDVLLFEVDGVRYSYDDFYGFNRSIGDFILYEAQKHGLHLAFKDSGLILKREECDIIENAEKAREEVLYRYMLDDNRARGVIPCGKKYSVLRIARNKINKAIKSVPFIDLYDSLEYPFMICPFIREYNMAAGESPSFVSLKYEMDDKVLNMVYENRSDETVTMEQIKNAYEEFKQEWSPIVERLNKKAVDNEYLFFGYRRLVY